MPYIGSYPPPPPPRAPPRRGSRKDFSRNPLAKLPEYGFKPRFYIIAAIFVARNATLKYCREFFCCSAIFLQTCSVRIDRDTGHRRFLRLKQKIPSGSCLEGTISHLSVLIEKKKTHTHTKNVHDTYPCGLEDNIKEWTALGFGDYRRPPPPPPPPKKKKTKKKKRSTQ